MVSFNQPINQSQASRTAEDYQNMTSQELKLVILEQLQINRLLQQAAEKALKELRENAETLNTSLVSVQNELLKSIDNSVDDDDDDWEEEEDDWDDEDDDEDDDYNDCTDDEEWNTEAGETAPLSPEEEVTDKVVEDVNVYLEREHIRQLRQLQDQLMAECGNYRPSVNENE